MVADKQGKVGSRSTLCSIKTQPEKRRMMTVVMSKLLSVATALLLLAVAKAVTTISTNKKCYAVGESIRISFTIDNPTQIDWVAVLPSDAALNPFEAHVTIDWVWVCGTQSCDTSNPSSSGSIFLDTSFIVEGTYKVVLVEPGSAVWIGAAQSKAFQIVPNEGCNGDDGIDGDGSSEGGNSPGISISTDKQSYTTNESILVSFESDEPQSGDWVSLFSASANRDQLFDGAMWMWVCGGQNLCSDLPTEGTLEFGQGGHQEAWSQRWPLAPGVYMAAIIRNTAQPYKALAVSNTFIVETVDDPDPTPTQDSVATDKSFYILNEDIVVSVENRNPEISDWVGLYKASASELRIGEMWMYACAGKALCSNPVREGTVVFGAGGFSERWAQTWPLKGGKYKAFLARSSDELPYEIIAESSIFEVLDVVQSVEDATNDIRELLARNPTLGPKFVRLGFHDCVGGCDGCVDLTDAENNGLEVPIAALESIVAMHENMHVGFSRADIWALAALMGADVAQPFPFVDFSMRWVGRRNCEDAAVVCLDDKGTSRSCGPRLGQFRLLPHADITTADLFHFFSNEFGFNVRETVALFGAHTLGVLTRENSGFAGEEGWVVDETILDNNYYFELVGNPDPSIPFEDQVDIAPPWFLFSQDNSDLAGVPDRTFWVAFPEGLEGQRIAMLNADIALVRELDNSNLDIKTGAVACGFVGEGRCPHAKISLQFAAEYRLDNRLWLTDFQDVFTRMLRNGYDTREDCDDRVCTLLPKTDL